MLAWLQPAKMADDFPCRRSLRDALQMGNVVSEGGLPARLACVPRSSQPGLGSKARQASSCVPDKVRQAANVITDGCAASAVAAAAAPSTLLQGGRGATPWWE